MKNKKKKIIVSTCLIVLLILAVVGVSYAAFSYIRTGEKVNQITTGTISMNYQESSNIIRITGALPTTDETGMKRLTDGEYFDFSVSTNLNGEAVINWEIAAEDFEDNTFDGSNVKFYLTKLEGDVETPVSETLPRVYSEETEVNEKTGRPSNMMSLLVGSTQTQGEETTNYRLRLYVDENYNPQGDGGSLVFKTRINVYGKVDVDEVPEKVQLPVMKAYTRNSTDDYHNSTYKKYVRTITVKTDTNIPETAISVTNGKGNYWDVSEAQDDSVIAYAEKIGIYYNITIGGHGGVAANENSSYLFAEFYKLENLDLSNLNTSNVTNMRGMFQGNYMETNVMILTNLDISNFDTSNVTDMSEMFYRCVKLTSLDLSNLDTSNVTNMNSMFSGCSDLTNLDISNFNGSNVTNVKYMFSKCVKLENLNMKNFVLSKVENMSYMFQNCSSLISLDLSKFNVSNVVDMSAMFYGCSSLTNLDISNFNGSNVTNVQSMFSKCAKLENLNMKNFVLSKVENMSYMFQNCSSLISLDLSKFNTLNVTTMESMFEYCSKLNEVNLSNFDTSNVTKMNRMFYVCKVLSFLDLTSFDTSSVTTMYNMFFDCYALTQINVSDKWNNVGTGIFTQAGTDHVTVV